MSYGKNLILSIVCLLMIASPAVSQTENTSINKQFKDVIENAESFKQYKVVPKSAMNTLFKQVMDTVAKGKSEIVTLNTEISTQQSTIEDLQNQLTTVTSDLENSNSLNDSIGFLGVDFQKSVYNIIVWGIIILLTAGVGSIYMLFKRSNKVTKITQNDLKRLTGELDAYKTKAHEKQVKLKRELQTAMNTLHEKGIKV